jgi:hypothetical protein
LVFGVLAGPGLSSLRTQDNGEGVVAERALWHPTIATRDDGAPVDFVDGELTGKSDGKNKNNSKEAAGVEMLFG